MKKFLPIILFLLSCSSQSTTESSDVSKDENVTMEKAEPEKPTISVDQLAHESTAANEIIHLITPDKLSKADLEKQIGLLAENRCGGVCMIYLWSDKKAYELLKEKRAISIEQYEYNAEKFKKALNQWEKKNWPFVCENLLATVSRYEYKNDISVYPYLDSRYKEVGGKMDKETLK